MRLGTQTAGTQTMATSGLVSGGRDWSLIVNTDVDSPPQQAFTRWPLPIGRIEQRHGLTFVYSQAPGGFRVGDYLKVPDKNRVELWDGILVVYPEWDRRRRALAMYFYELLKHMCEGELDPFIGPMDVPVSKTTVFAPDLLVFSSSGPPVLVVEFRRDRTAKMLEEKWAKLGGYAKAGVKVYWAVDPDTLTLTVYERQGRGRRAVWSQPEDAPGIVGAMCTDSQARDS